MLGNHANSKIGLGTTLELKFQLECIQIGMYDPCASAAPLMPGLYSIATLEKIEFLALA